MTKQMTASDVECLAHQFRLQIQSQTCCPRHAGEVLMVVLAGMAMDNANDDPHEAARTIMKGAREWSKAVREGRFRMARSSQ